MQTGNGSKHTVPPPGTSERQRQLTDQEMDQETARLFGEICRQNRRDMQSELDAELVSSDVMDFRLG